MSRIDRLILAISLPSLLISASVNAQTAGADAQLLVFEQKIEQGRYSEVEDGLMKFVIANQNSARGFQALARLRSHQDRLAEARGLYRRALALDKSLVPAKLELAIVELQLGRKSEGLGHLNEIAAKQLSTETRLKLAQTLVLFGEFAFASDIISALPQSIQNGAALPIRAVCYLELRDDEKIGPLVKVAERSVARSPMIVVRFAEALAGTRFSKDAMLVLRSVVALHPRNVAALLLLAKIEIEAREIAQARKHVRQAAALAPDSADVAFGEAMLSTEEGDWSAALAHLERALEKRPNSVPVMREIVIAAMRAKQAPRAIEIARKLMDTRPEEPEFVYLFGAATLQIGRDSEAEGYLERYLEMRPNDSRGCLALGISLIGQPAKLSAGQSRLEQCIISDPGNFEAIFQLGLTLKANGESERAMKLFEQALQISPRFVPALRELGTLQLQAGQTASARLSLENAATIEPNDANTHFQLSRLYNLTGETELAKVHFEKFQKLKVTN